MLNSLDPDPVCLFSSPDVWPDLDLNFFAKYYINRYRGKDYHIYSDYSDMFAANHTQTSPFDNLLYKGKWFTP